MRGMRKDEDNEGEYDGVVALKGGKIVQREPDPVAQRRILAGDSLAGHIEADLLRDSLAEA